MEGGLGGGKEAELSEGGGKGVRGAEGRTG